MRKKGHLILIETKMKHLNYFVCVIKCYATRPRDRDLVMPALNVQCETRERLQLYWVHETSDLLRPSSHVPNERYVIIRKKINPKIMVISSLLQLEYHPFDETNNYISQVIYFTWWNNGCYSVCYNHYTFKRNYILRIFVMTYLEFETHNIRWLSPSIKELRVFMSSQITHTQS